MNYPFTLELYSEQTKRWSTSGRHIYGHYNDDIIVVYQAYKPSIGHPAVQYQNFITSNPDFRVDRMTWIKPNFLWMMYRSGWGTKKNQETILAISLSRIWFEEILSTKSPVRVQWDPDHDPLGNATSRRALQIGIWGKAVEEYAKGTSGRAVVAIHDISEFVHETETEITDAKKHGIQASLKLPLENVYPASTVMRNRLEMDVLNGRFQINLNR